MKLGLKIEITSNGAGSAARTFNSSQALELYASSSRSYVKEVFPTRDDLKQIGLDPLTSFDESEKSVVFLKFLGLQGYLICLIISRPEGSGRPYDGCAAWIHVPANVILEGRDALGLIENVKHAINKKYGIDYLMLEEIFNREYQECKSPSVKFIASNGKNSGVIYYGNGTLNSLDSLLGNNIAQLEYNNYKAIFLVNNGDNIKVSCEKIQIKIHAECVVDAPSASNGFYPYFENRELFEGFISVPFGMSLSVIWKKEGYRDIRKSALIQKSFSSNEQSPFSFNISDVRLIVRREWFVVSGPSEYKIYLKNELLESELYISIEDLKYRIPVTVSATGFEDYKEEIYLSEETKRIPISLKKLIYQYNFSIPIYDGKNKLEDSEFVVKSRQLLKQCPVDGYRLSDPSLRLEPRPNKVYTLEKGIERGLVRNFIYGFITCLICVSLYIGWTILSPHIWTKSDDGTSVSMNDSLNRVISRKLTKQSTEIETKYAALYLKTNLIWTKDYMEEFNCMKGLFEALNNYEIDKLETLSKTFGDKSVLKKIVNNLKNGSKQKSRPQPPYNKDSKIKTIVIEEYLKNITTDENIEKNTSTRRNSENVVDKEKGTSTEKPKEKATRRQGV